MTRDPYTDDRTQDAIVQAWPDQFADDVIAQLKLVTLKPELNITVASLEAADVE